MAVGDLSGQDPTVRRVSYSIRRAFETNAFAQFDVVDDRKFVRLAKDRGVHLGSYGSNELEHLDELGALRPLAFWSERWGPPSVFREETPFVPWDEYAIDEDGFRRTVALYSPWQLLYLKHALDLGTTPASVEWILDTKKRRRLGSGHRSWLERQVEERSGLDDAWRDALLLLIRIQNRYMPSARGTLTTRTVMDGWDPKTGERIRDDETRTFKPKRALRDLGLEVSHVKNVHRRLVGQAVVDDPLENWSTLVRMAPYRERQKLKGQALVSQDGYDAGAMLRDFYYDLTGELLPQPDEMYDVSDGSWRERIYGHGPTLRYTRADLRAELQRHGLYPHLVHLVVEGESEKLLFEALVSAYGFEPSERGVSISIFRGVGKSDLRAELLRAAHAHTRFPILVSDREGGIEREVEALQREGLLVEDTTFLWKESLEADNFSHAELARLAKNVARSKGATLRLTGKALREAHEARSKRVPVGLGRVLLSLARSPEHGSVQISKLELAAEMAALLTSEMRNAADLDALTAKRPIVGLLVSILRVT
jgi:hypothetical protein